MNRPLHWDNLALSGNNPRTSLLTVLFGLSVFSLILLKGTRLGKLGRVLPVIALALACSGFTGTLAVLTGQTGNAANSFSTTALYAPTNLTAISASGSVQLNWTAGLNGNSYTVLGGDNGVNATCPAATTPGFYTTTIGTTSGTTYTDPRSIAAGHTYCYQVQTAYKSWTSVQTNPVAAVSVAGPPDQPTNLTATPAGRNVLLNWTAGLNATGYDVLGVANGVSSACPAAASPGYSLINSTNGPDFSDANRAAPAGVTPSGGMVPQGSWYCYLVNSTDGASTSAGNPVAGVQVGFVVTSVQLINGNTPDRIDAGDMIVVDFNQPVNPATGPGNTDTVASEATSGQLLIGSAVTSGAPTAGETVSLGSLTGSFSSSTRFSATYAWTNGNKTLTVTLGSKISGPASAKLSPTTWTFNPTTTAANLQSSAGANHICDTNTGGGNCLPTPTGGF
jgi:hypothetical protein